MKQQTLLTIAIGLTAFVMLAIGGVIITTQAAQAQSSAQAPAQVQPAQDQNDIQNQQVGQDFLNQIAAREAQYQALINQANAQLEQAQKDEKSLLAQVDALKNTNAQLAAQAATQAAAQAAAQPVSLTPQQASQVASDYMHQKDLYSVETVSYYGSSVYKVTFSSGAIVFVNTYGQIMSAQSAPSAAGPSSGGGGHKSSTRTYEHEHEDNDD